MSIVAVHGPHTFGSMAVKQNSTGTAYARVNPANGMIWTFYARDTSLANTAYDWAYTPAGGTPTSPINDTKSPTITFTGAGTKTVTLTLNGVAQAPITITAVSGTAPLMFGLSYEPDPDDPNTLHFTLAPPEDGTELFSVNNPDALVDFGDGTTETTTEPTFSHTYAEEGSYTVVVEGAELPSEATAEVTVGGAADPNIDSLTPSSGEVGVAVSVTVAGSNFEDGSVVEAGGTALSTAFVSETELTADFTPDAEGTVNFTVRNPSEKESNDSPFTVTAAGTATSEFDPGAHTVEEVKAYADEHADDDVEIQRLYDAEINNRNRIGVISYLEALLPYDPGDYTVQEVVDYAAANPDQLEDIIAAEQAGKNRSTLISQLEALRA